MYLKNEWQTFFQPGNRPRQSISKVRCRGCRFQDQAVRVCLYTPGFKGYFFNRLTAPRDLDSETGSARTRPATDESPNRPRQLEHAINFDSHIPIAKATSR